MFDENDSLRVGVLECVHACHSLKFKASLQHYQGVKMSKEDSVHSRHHISGRRRKNQGKTMPKLFKNTERGTPSRPNKSGWCRNDCYPQPKPINQCISGLIGWYSRSLCPTTFTFFCTTPYPVALHSELWALLSGCCCWPSPGVFTDALHCCAIPAILTHASVLFAVCTSQFPLSLTLCVFLLSSNSKVCASHLPLHSTWLVLYCFL